MEIALFRRVLLEAQRAHQLVSIYQDPNELGRFAVGFVSAVRDEDFTLEEVNPEGLPDGTSVRRLEEILRVDIGDRYANQILLLMENREALEDELVEDEEIGIPPVSCMQSVLERAQATEAVVSFHLDTGDDDLSICGTVRRATESCVQIDRLTEDGEPDGMTTLPLELIGRIRMDGRNERKVALLNSHRTHLYL